MERHLLVVFPHPDDETFACGGTIASHAAAGTPVTYLCATRGEMGRRMGKPAFATRESLPLLREQELRQACAALGIADLRLLGICDKTVEFLDPAALAARIGAVIDEVRPSLVLTFHPVHGGHPDHCAVGAATVQAVAARPRAGRSCSAPSACSRPASCGRVNPSECPTRPWASPTWRNASGRPSPPTAPRARAWPKTWPGTR